MKDTKSQVWKNPKVWIPVIVALITALGSIGVVVIPKLVGGVTHS